VGTRKNPSYSHVLGTIPGKNATVYLAPLKLYPDMTAAEITQGALGLDSLGAFHELTHLIIDLPQLVRGYVPGQETASHLSLSLKDDRGKVVYNGRLPNVAFDPTFSSLNLALTNGKWAMQLSLPNECAGIRSLPLTVTIKARGCTRITVKKGRRSYRPCR
jgi:hypothetical protein